MDIKLYEVGGCIRDELLGLKTKDVDFSVEAPSFQDMKNYLEDEGFHIFVENPEYLTIRARPPKGSKLAERTKGADFVLCRRDSEYSDGRRPDYVEIGTIYDDLSRRDFTVNAIARDCETQEIIDPHGGLEDIDIRCLRFVGEPEKRITEDGLRVLRGYRFMVTKEFVPDIRTGLAFRAKYAIEAMKKISNERIIVELDKMFKHNTVRSLDILAHCPYEMQKAIFKDNVRLGATLKS